jgi:hypothetical protein
LIELEGRPRVVLLQKNQDTERNFFYHYELNQMDLAEEFLNAKINYRQVSDKISLEQPGCTVVHEVKVGTKIISINLHWEDFLKS